MLYPPHDLEGLHKLLQAIDNTTYDTLKRDCLVYYLLKWHKDGREERFQMNRCIPPQFALLADAYFYLDTGVNTAKAVSIFSDSRLKPDFASKCLHAITFNGRGEPADKSILIRQYVRTTKPVFQATLDLEYYAMALAEMSLQDAWQFQRTFPEGERRLKIIRALFTWTLISMSNSFPIF